MHLFESSLQQRLEIEEAHLAATLNDDLELALKKKTELDYLDGIFKLTMEIHKTDGGMDSWQNYTFIACLRMRTSFMASIRP